MEGINGAAHSETKVTLRSVFCETKQMNSAQEAQEFLSQTTLGCIPNSQLWTEVQPFADITVDSVSEQKKTGYDLTAMTRVFKDQNLDRDKMENVSDSVWETVNKKVLEKTKEIEEYYKMDGLQVLPDVFQTDRIESAFSNWKADANGSWELDFSDLEPDDTVEAMSNPDAITMFIARLPGTKGEKDTAGVLASKCVSAEVERIPVIGTWSDITMVEDGKFPPKIDFQDKMMEKLAQKIHDNVGEGKLVLKTLSPFAGAVRALDEELTKLNSEKGLSFYLKNKTISGYGGPYNQGNTSDEELKYLSDKGITIQAESNAFMGKGVKTYTDAGMRLDLDRELQSDECVAVRLQAYLKLEHKNIKAIGVAENLISFALDKINKEEGSLDDDFTELVNALKIIKGKLEKLSKLSERNMESEYKELGGLKEKLDNWEGTHDVLSNHLKVDVNAVVTAYDASIATHSDITSPENDREKVVKLLDAVPDITTRMKDFKGKILKCMKEGTQEMPPCDTTLGFLNRIESVQPNLVETNRGPGYRSKAGYLTLDPKDAKEDSKDPVVTEYKERRLVGVLDDEGKKPKPEFKEAITRAYATHIFLSQCVKGKDGGWYHRGTPSKNISTQVEEAEFYFKELVDSLTTTISI